MTREYLKASAAVVVCSALVAGCGGKVLASGTGGAGGFVGSGGSGSGSGGTCAKGATPCGVPPPSNAPPGGGGLETVIAVHHFYLGDANVQGQTDPNAWKRLGYDLDGLVSTPKSQNHCQPVPGANPAYVKADGDGGIDNSFGENLMPLLDALAVDFSASDNQWIAHGKGTEIIKLDHLRDPAQAPDQNGIGAALYTAADKGSYPLFNGTDVWPVTAGSVLGGNIDAPRFAFPKSYVSGGLWVSGPASVFTIELHTDGVPMPLPLSRAVITMHIKSAGKDAATGDGIIAGVMNTEQFIVLFQKVVGVYDPALCDGPTFDSIAQQIKSASDIMADGSNGDPSKICDAISVGLGFDGSAARISTVAPSQPTTNTCPGTP